MRVRREPPRLIEGPFGSVFTDGRRLARMGWKVDVHPRRVYDDESEEDDDDDDEGEVERDKGDEEEWPPRRASQKMIGAKMSKSEVQGRDNNELAGAVLRSAPTEAPLDTTGTSKSVNGGHPGHGHNQNGILSASNGVNQVNANDDEGSPKHAWDSSVLPKQPIEAIRKLFEDMPSRFTVAPLITADPANTRKPQGSSTRQEIGSNAGEEVAPATAPPPANPLVGSNGRPSIFPMRSESVSDPFLVSAAPRVGTHGASSDNGKGKEKAAVVSFTDPHKRRRTFGGFSPSPDAPVVDLSVVMKRPYDRLLRSHHRQSLPAPGAVQAAPPSFRGSSVPIPPRSSDILHPSSSSSSLSPSLMSTADQSLALRLGTDLIFKRMSENHGFHEDIVRRIYAEVGGFERADAVLNDMREAAEAAGRKSINLDPPNGSTHTSQHVLASSRRTSLHFSPAPVTGDDNRSDYSPPEASRAGQFARLLRQGRREEALRREARAASLGGRNEFLLQDMQFPSSEGVYSQTTSGALATTRGHESPQSPLALKNGTRAKAAVAASSGNGL